MQRNGNGSRPAPLDRDGGRGLIRSPFFKPTKYGSLDFGTVFQPDPDIGFFLTGQNVIVPAGKYSGGKLRAPLLLPQGTVLLTRSLGRKTPTHAIYKDGLYSAVRGELHALAVYDESAVGGDGGEVRTVISDDARLEEVFALLEAWRSLSESDQKLLATTLHSFLVRNARVRDLDKLVAREEVFAVHDLKDGAKRPNPAVTRTRLRIARDHLFERLGSIRSIHPRLAARLIVIENEITVSLAACEEIKRTLLGILDTLREKKRASPAVLMAKIKICLDRLEVLRGRPFFDARICLAPAIAYAGMHIGMNSAGALRGTEALLCAAVHVLNIVSVRNLILRALQTISVMPSGKEAQRGRFSSVTQLLGRVNEEYRSSLLDGATAGSVFPDWRAPFDEALLKTTGDKDPEVTKYLLNEAASALLYSSLRI